MQESAKDRPSISTVLSMLSSEIAHLPPPKHLHSLQRWIVSLLNRDETNFLLIISLLQPFMADRIRVVDKFNWLNCTYIYKWLLSEESWPMGHVLLNRKAL